MKVAFVAFLAVMCSIGLAAIVSSPNLREVDTTPDPNAIVRDNIFKPFAYCQPPVIVPLEDIDSGMHGVAHQQFKTLYPEHADKRVTHCEYSTYGTSRIYTFSVSVSNGKDTSISTTVEDDNYSSSNSTDADDDDNVKAGYVKIQLTIAYSDNEISIAINFIVQDQWTVVKGNSIHKVWKKEHKGVVYYRIYFKNVEGHFDYDKSSGKCAYSAQSIKKSSNSDDDTYFANQQPIYSGAAPTYYNDFYYKDQQLDKFKQKPGYGKVIKSVNESLGNLDQKWILNISYSEKDGTHYYQITVNFVPFLVKQTYEAHYYGSIDKAALLKIDQKTFDSTGDAYVKWCEIKNFRSYPAFDEAYEFVLYQYPWLRFYDVVSAYTTLHKNGRIVRLVYIGKGQFVDAQNQINIVVFVDSCGKYFIDRNDFLATSLGSYGRNDWVSLFVPTPDVTKAEYYQRIVKFFKSIYPQFWSSNQLEDIKIKGNLHVIFLRNPTNNQSHRCVLNINSNNLEVLNKINWTVLADDSPLKADLWNYVKKYNATKVMFVQYYNTSSGTHFEVSYLNDKGQYACAYILYNEADDVFTEDKQYDFEGKSYGASYDEVPLPNDVKASIRVYIAKIEVNLTSVNSIVSLTVNTYEVVVVISQCRWIIVITWVRGQWQIKSKKTVGDGYFVAKGYPSVTVTESTAFVGKLYGKHFQKSYNYVLVQTKNVGLNLYVRIIYNINGDAFEAVVKVIFGAKTTQVLISWTPLQWCNSKDDYGYGRDFIYSYGGIKSTDVYHADKSNTVTINIDASVKTEVHTDKNCVTWAGARCSICNEDYAVGNNGICTKMDDYCIVRKNGRCVECEYGYKPEPFTGQCIIYFGSLNYAY